MDGLQVWLPCLQLLLRVIEDLPSVVGVRKWLANVSGNNGRVIEVVEQATTVSGKYDLFLGALDGGSEVQIVSFLELLTGLMVLAMG